jgi:hypothetical protein
MVWEWNGCIWFDIALWYCVIHCARCVLCDPLCLCDHTLWYTLIQLNWVVLAYNLIGYFDSSIGAFLCSTSLKLYPCYYGLHIIIFPHLLSTNHKCTKPCPPATQKLNKSWSTSVRNPRRVIAPDWLPVELWSLSAAVSLREFDLVFCKTYSVINIIYCDIGYYVSIFCTVCV